MPSLRLFKINSPDDRSLEKRVNVIVSSPNGKRTECKLILSEDEKSYYATFTPNEIGNKQK